MKRLLLLLSLGGALAVAGCGGGTPPTLAEYEQSVVTARDRVDFALERITKAKDKEDFLDRMDEASAAIDKAADELEDVGAAKGYEDETEALASALHQLSFDLSATASDLRQPEGEAFITGARGINFQSWVDANNALGALKGRGVKVEPIARH